MPHCKRSTVSEWVAFLSECHTAKVYTMPEWVAFLSECHTAKVYTMPKWVAFVSECHTAKVYTMPEWVAFVSECHTAKVYTIPDLNEWLLSLNATLQKINSVWMGGFCLWMPHCKRSTVSEWVAFVSEFHTAKDQQCLNKNQNTERLFCMKLLSLLSCHHHQSFVLITSCKRCINFKEIKNTKFREEREKQRENNNPTGEQGKKRKKAPANHGMIRKEQHRDEDLCVFYTLTVLKVSVAELRSSHLFLGERTLHVFCHVQRKKAYYETAKHNKFITQ